MNFHIVTLFPESFESYLNESILARAIKQKKIKVKFYNPRDFVKSKHAWSKPVDGRPYGGGPGMVMQAEPVIKAIAKAKGKTSPGPSKACLPARQGGEEKKSQSHKIIWLSPGGKQFDNTFAEKLSTKEKNIILVCGRYEGIDERVKKVFKMSEVSIGPFVLTGGELPAMIMIDCITRRLPGVLGNDSSIEEKRTSSHKVYTRPEVLIYKGKKYKVPEILLSGNHKKIEEWKRGKL